MTTIVTYEDAVEQFKELVAEMRRTLPPCDVSAALNEMHDLTTLEGAECERDYEDDNYDEDYDDRLSELESRIEALERRKPAKA